MAIEQGKINNYSLAEGKVVNLVVSLSKHRGRILTKKTPQISKYFGYTQHSFKQIKNIQQLMPDYIGQNHNEFMMNFVNRYQQPSDFCINASILKYESNDNTIMFDQYGNIFGIDEELFNIIFKNKTSVQSENSKKFISTVINSKSSLHYSSRRSNKNTQFENLSAIQLYQNGSIQFLLPMIINVFKHLKQEINLQERYLDYPLVQSQQAFLKISKEALNIKPRCIDYINQDQQSQGSKYFLKRSVYSQNTYNTQNTNMNTERRAMMKQMDLLNTDLNQKVYEFINDHLYFYEKQNIYGNYVINYDVYFSNIIYGPEQDKNSPYFTLKITNIYANLNQNDVHASSIFNSQVVALNYQVESLTKQTKQSLGTQKTKYGQQLSYRGQQRQYEDFDDFQDNINEVKEEPESSESLQKKKSDSEKNNIKDNNNNNLQSNENFDFSQSQFAVNLLQNNNDKQKIGVENLGKQLQVPESQLMVDNLSDEKSPMAKNQDINQNQNQKNDLNSTCLQDSTSRNLLGLSSINNPLITVRDEVEALQNQNSSENPRLLDYINESKQDGIQEEMTQNDLNSSLDSNKNSRKREKNYNKQISQLGNKTDKKQNPYQSYLGEYAMTNNQVQKDGETSFQQPMISEHIMTTEQDNYVPLTMQDEQEDIEKQTINSGGNSRGYSKKSILKQKSSPKGEQNYVIKSGFQEYFKFKLNFQQKDEGQEDDIDDQLEKLDKIQINNLNNKELYQNQEMQNQLEKMKKNSKKSLKNFLNNKKKKKEKKDNNDSSITQNHGFQRGNQSLNILKQYFSKKNRYPKTVFILLNMKALYIVLFIVMIFIFQQELVSLLDTETTGIKNQHISYQLQYQYNQGFLAGLGLIYLKYDFLEGNYNNVDLEKELNKQLVESAQKYEEIVRKKENNIYQIQDNNQGKEVQTQIYSIFEVESQEMQMTQFFNYISQEFLAFKDQINTHKDLVKFISELYRKEAVNKGKQVFDSFLQFIIISTLVFIGVSMFFVPFIIQYKKYQEKILLLVTRIYEYEAEIEQRKIQQCVQKLESTGEQWIQESFIELTQQKSFEKLKNQKNKHQVLQGKIFQTSLSLNYQLVQLVLMTLSVTLFFAIITIISTIQQKKSDPVIELQYECQIDNFYINQLIFSSEMLIVREDLFSQIPYFDDKLNKENLQQQIEDSVQVLGNFFTQFEDILGENYAVTSETQQQIKNGLKNSLCSLDICDSDMSKAERSFYENGLSGVMSYYLTNIQTYHDLIYDKISDNAKKQELIKQYHNNDQHYYYIQQSYKVPFKAYSKLIDILLQDNTSSISKTTITRS
ncbi:hypothetical protein PPERSA_06216 [Pseudocohnilembus persalinus]|uniref:Transmembrane protein n=1 Tax=Pseudocohnilembus persalinus TaxID=266149 RepID=A0A0V0R0G7_PSEPJ|nr:hypothetical protein PPERSA_06216 [Pseudocohnilembus persalinus]|eukprot:KRX08038.1 hypothetical protein PPERSA_06216 [Pseudocohnilembus persalinus]